MTDPNELRRRVCRYEDMARRIDDDWAVQELYEMARRSIDRADQIEAANCIPDYPSKFTVRLVTDTPTPYILIANTLAEIHAALPPRLVRSERQPADLPEVVEIWFTG